ncbi:MAG: V-type ATPase subunit [Treponema sp.]|nr:V-type ATPase subunit [Treponema sp.]
MAMDKSAADAYVYSKASGMLANSFIGPRAVRLFNVHTLQELWGLLFNAEVPVIPETLLAKALEVEAQKKFIAEFKSLINNYSSPSDIYVSLLHSYEYENIKEIGAALCFKEEKMPEIVDISPFNFIHYNKWPKIEEMTADSALSWYNKVPDVSEQQKNDYLIDSSYVNELWTSCKKLKSSCRPVVADLFLKKICLDNILWAMRLKIYYQMSNDEIISHLAYSSDERSLKDVFIQDALKILDWDVGNWENWKNWKYAGLLNPHEEGVVWNVDPRWIYNVSKKNYVRKAYRLFHLYPFTECPLVCWFILKQNELDNIRTASESLRLSVPSEQAMENAGILEVTNHA